MRKSEEPINPLLGSQLDYSFNGLTKREYFAGLAMQGLLSHYGIGKTLLGRSISQEAVIRADSLLAALEKQNDPN